MHKKIVTYSRILRSDISPNSHPLFNYLYVHFNYVISDSFAYYLTIQRSLILFSVKRITKTLTQLSVPINKFIMPAKEICLNRTLNQKFNVQTIRYEEKINGSMHAPCASNCNICCNILQLEYITTCCNISYLVQLQLFVAIFVVSITTNILQYLL